MKKSKRINKPKRIKKPKHEGGSFTDRFSNLFSYFTRNHCDNANNAKIMEELENNKSNAVKKAKEVIEEAKKNLDEVIKKADANIAEEKKKLEKAKCDKKTEVGTPTSEPANNESPQGNPATQVGSPPQGNPATQANTIKNDSLNSAHDDYEDHGDFGHDDDEAHGDFGPGENGDFKYGGKRPRKHSKRRKSKRRKPRKSRRK